MRLYISIKLSLFFLLILFTSQLQSQDLRRFEFSEPKMGTSFRLVFYTVDSSSAVTLKDSAFQLVDRFNAIFSDYDPESEVSRLSDASGNGEFVEVSSTLRLLINRSFTFYAISDKVFDITIGPLSKLWRRAFRRNEMPSAEEILAAKSLVSSDYIKHQGKRSLRLTKKGMRLDFGGIAKGFTVDAIFQSLTKKGVTQLLVDGGGDIRVGDPPPGKEGWSITLPNGNLIKLSNKGLATSGDQYKFIEHEGRRYSHIIDPRTGYGVVDAPTVVVIGIDCYHADVAASTYCILGKEGMAEFLKSTNEFNFEFIEL